jgi:hypothetical protein
VATVVTLERTGDDMVEEGVHGLNLDALKGIKRNLIQYGNAHEKSRLVY